MVKHFCGRVKYAGRIFYYLTFHVAPSLGLGFLSEVGEFWSWEPRGVRRAPGLLLRVVNNCGYGIRGERVRSRQLKLNLFNVGSGAGYFDLGCDRNHVADRLLMFVGRILQMFGDLLLSRFVEVIYNVVDGLDFYVF